jgi:type III pantothenate kinase
MKTIRRRWLIDLGNSRLKCALLDAQSRRGEILTIGHEQANAIPTLLQHLGQGSGDDEVWLASVASVERTQAVSDAVLGAGLDLHRVQTQSRFGRVRVVYPEPAHLGVDRFLGLLAANERKDGPWLIVSAGSALTVDLLAADGEHHGGLIAPMPAHMRAVLAENFAQLDLPQGRPQDFADDTADAIASGIRAAVLGLVERSLRKAQDKLGTVPTLLVGGGGAELLAYVDHSKVVIQPSLVLDGLAAFVRGAKPA